MHSGVRESLISFWDELREEASENMRCSSFPLRKIWSLSLYCKNHLLLINLDDVSNESAKLRVGGGYEFIRSYVWGVYEGSYISVVPKDEPSNEFEVGRLTISIFF